MTLRTLAILLVACPVAMAQTTTPPSQTASSASATALPVRRVVLYKTGIGYFEHLGRVRGNQDVTIRFTSGQLNDVLKSLTAIDMGNGQVTGISYNSIAPIAQRLGALRLPLNQGSSMVELLQALRGARVEVAAGASAASGRVLSVETITRTRSGEAVQVPGFSIVTDTGEVRTFELTPETRVRVLERDLRQEIGRYLDVVGSAREQDVRSMTISTTGAGERSLFVSYISEVPIWKTTYRLVLPGKGGRPLLQGWAIVDNTIGEDWNGVELSLVAGAPQSFIQQISQPYFGQRPVVPLPSNVLMNPQTHQATLGSGSGMLRGVVRDAVGGPLPGVTLTMTGASGSEAAALTNERGEYEVSVPTGVYSIRADLAGFNTARAEGVVVWGGSQVRQDLSMRLGSVGEAVTIMRQSATVGGLPPPPPPPPPPPAMPLRADALAGKAISDITQELRDARAAATAQDLGDLFEYRLDEPVTLQKNQSALVPIVNAEVIAEKVALWTAGQSSTRPLRAVWLTNGSKLTLDGGSMAIIDGNTFAGEGLVEPLKAGERRLVSYAADLGILVKSNVDSAPGRVLRIRAQNGVITRESEERAAWTYTARNEDDEAIPLVIEHRMRPGWKLAPGQEPAESTVDTQRFRVVLEPKKETSLVVREVRTGDTRIAVGDVTDALIAEVAAAGLQTADLQRTLKPVLDKRVELARAERQLQDLRAQQQEIVGDQTRLRENMKALRGSAEEKQLLQRYTRQLDQQETRLETIKAAQTKATAERDRIRQELSELISALSFDVSR